MFDPRNGDLSLRVTDLDLGPGTTEPDRINCFTIVWVESGSGAFSVDDAHLVFDAPCLLFSTPYQYLRLAPDCPTRGTILRFHANFLCVETYHHEVGCNGVLFNDPYGVPSVAIQGPDEAEVADLIGRIRRELAGAGLAHSEVLVSYLKVLLVLATRLKLREGARAVQTPGKRPAILDDLRDLIETNYRTLHAPTDYADRLHMTPKALGRVIREHLGKTLTSLIRDRVIKHAKWELLHTLRPVKEIAREVGYDDELYFSRLFKKATGYSPTFFREYETAIRGGSNLSISSRQPSIPPTALSGKNANNPASEPRKSGP